MPGRPSRDKGLRAERQLKALHELMGIKAERVPLSGSLMYRGNSSDLDVYAFGEHAAPLVCEVKARASGSGFTMLERWMSDADLLFLRRDRAQPIVVMPWQTYERILHKLRGQD